MSIKVFFLGRPGSGKSTAVRHFIEYTYRNGYLAICMKDYDILYEMFQADKKEQFRPTEYGGFDVLDKTVFDVALKQLEENVQSAETSCSELVAIEFARDDYHTAFRLFGPEFLEGSYIFFVDCDLEDCIYRIYLRAMTPVEPDHHFVSEYIMRTYYNTENLLYMTSQMEKEYKGCKKVATFRNIGLREELLKAVESFAELIFQDESLKQKPCEIVEVEPVDLADPLPVSLG